MEKIIAHCGLVCSGCPAFIATAHDSDEERRKVAEEWSKAFGTELKPEDINCRGCLAQGDDIFGYCKICEIRLCSLERGLKNCAHCKDYACERLVAWFGNVPDAKTTLDEVRKGL